MDTAAAPELGQDAPRHVAAAAGAQHPQHEEQCEAQREAGQGEQQAVEQAHPEAVVAQHPGGQPVGAQPGAADDVEQESQGQGGQGQPWFYVLFNAHWESHQFSLPRIDGHYRWRRLVDTNLPTPDDIVEEPNAVPLEPGDHYLATPRSVVMLIG